MNVYAIPGIVRGRLRPRSFNRRPIRSRRRKSGIQFRFENLEITSDALVLHFYEDKTVVPLKGISSYHLKWHLHTPTFGKKWWFLVLTVEIDHGEEESGPVAFTKFNYVNDDHQLRERIEDKIAHAIDSALHTPRPWPGPGGISQSLWIQQA
jgi:hypothetical protein